MKTAFNCCKPSGAFMNPTKRFLPLALIGLLHAGQALALPEDKDQPINIEADSAELDDQKGVSVYVGRVRVKQGSLEVEADKVTIYSDDSGVTEMIAVGQPVHFKQQPKLQEPYDHGYAKRLEYDMDKDELTLLQEAKLIRDRDTFTGERILIDTANDVVSAFSGDKGDRRVNMVLQPKKKDAQP